MLGLKHLFRGNICRQQTSLLSTHLIKSPQRQKKLTEEVNAETGLPAVKHNRLNPRNRFTIAHWVNLQKAGNRDPGIKCLPTGRVVPFPAKQAHSQFCSQSYTKTLVTKRKHESRDPHAEHFPTGR